MNYPNMSKTEFFFMQQKIKLKPKCQARLMPLCKRIFCCIYGVDLFENIGSEKGFYSAGVLFFIFYPYRKNYNTFSV